MPTGYHVFQLRLWYGFLVCLSFQPRMSGLLECVGAANQVKLRVRCANKG